MSKYTFELKKKVVLEYLNGGIGYIPLAKKYGIKSEANIRVWAWNMEMKPYAVQEKMNILSKKRYLL